MIALACLFTNGGYKFKGNTRVANATVDFEASQLEIDYGGNSGDLRK